VRHHVSERDMVLDNDTRGWVMAIVSGIGAFVFGCVYGVSIANGRGGQLVFLEVKMRLRGVFNCSELMANSVDNMRRSCGATVPG
jgi:hypothetical protein